MSIVVNRSGTSALVSGWLQAQGHDIDETESTEDKDTATALMQEARPSRLGLGAKFLSHKEAAKLEDDKRMNQRVQNKIITGKNKRNRSHAMNAKEEAGVGTNQDSEGSDEEEEESRTNIGGVGGSKGPSSSQTSKTLSALLQEAEVKKARNKRKRQRKKEKKRANEQGKKEG